MKGPGGFGEVVRWNTAGQMEGYLKIKTKAGDVIRPEVNEYQAEISEIVEWCHDHGRPCRIIGLKPRQKGSSTVSVGVGHVRLKAKDKTSGLIAGGAHFQGSNLFGILSTYAEEDELDPGSCKVQDKVAVYANGSEMGRITLANSNAGRSGTYQFMLVTEVAYLAEEGVANAAEVLNGLLKCVGFEPDTIIILESTAKGASGDYYERYQKAITFDEFKAGKDGYVKVFCPWYRFKDSRRDPEKEGIVGWESLTDFEGELSRKWGLDLEQIAWMRWALRDECNGDWDRFCQDYPFDEETAFLKSGRGRFNVDGLKYQDEVSRRSLREHGVLEMDKYGRVVFRPVNEDEARVVRWERPVPGRRYILAVDLMTGESQTGSDDPDSHGYGVIRAGYLDAGTHQWVPPALVARGMLYPDKRGRMGCWWDIDVLEEEVYRMAKYYGDCIIAPEMNMDRGLVELLKLRFDANIYQRELFNQREGVKTKALGWVTDVRTRGMVVENLARAIREAGRGSIGEGIEIRDPWTIRECRNFVVKKNGRAEAAAGHHDDQVMFLAIGLTLIDHATPFIEPVVEGWIPPDLRGSMGAGEGQRYGRAQFS